MLPPPGSCVISGSVHFIFALMESLWGVDILRGSSFDCLWSAGDGYLWLRQIASSCPLRHTHAGGVNACTSTESVTSCAPRVFILFFSKILLLCEHRFLSLLLHPSTTTSGRARFRSPLCLVTPLLVAEVTGAAAGCPLLRHGRPARQPVFLCPSLLVC